MIFPRGKKVNLPGVLYALPAVLLFVSGTAQAANCGYLLSYRAFIASTPTVFATIEAYNQAQEAEKAELKKAASSLFENYLKGEHPDPIEVCGADLAKSKLDLFDEKLPEVFFDESLDRLASSGTSTAGKIAEAVCLRKAAGTWTLFRLVGHLSSRQNPTGEKGGYLRATGSIFLDYPKIDPNEWLIIFGHEVAHSLDPRLRSAPYDFNSPKLRDFIRDLAARSPKELTSKDEIRLRGWLIAGLDRGYFAEVRAWAVTTRLYEELRARGEIEPIRWMENLIASKRSSEDWETYFIRVLNERFADPANGPFAVPVVRRMLLQIRKEALEGRYDVGRIDLR